jgi:hypothetical protein
MFPSPMKMLIPYDPEPVEFVLNGRLMAKEKMAVVCLLSQGR